jgi:hypothetical protein
MRSVFLVFAAATALAAGPVYQVSLDSPRGYTVLRGSATLDGAVLRNNSGSLRVEPAGSYPDAAVRFAPVQLVIGKRYELTGWVKTENLEVRDLDRSPIATGAALSMASMPFDVHSSSVGGTRGWTRVSLKFVSSRAQDQILITVGNGGAFRGKAWFEGISLDETGSGGAWPVREAVQSFGPAYRYPSAGWTYLHIEGAPYERGYQHGHLMAREIPEYLARCAADLGAAEGWNDYRVTVNALFLRGFDREILEEMRGIAEGAADAGARWQGRRIDLVDIVVANVTVELGELRSAIGATPTGLEGLTFDKPPYAVRDSVLDHCSAFAATGPATRDGKMVIGHVTWWPLALAEQTNVMLDIHPASGHRILMQSYPGGIESGTDWYQNDAGMVLTETTIRQTPFNGQGTPVAFRARNAIQYSASVEEVVQRLGARNNGLYTNEWLIGDGKTNEIAMYELGTHNTRLWRSSKNEWFGGTPGFYWGNNNAKDLAIRLEPTPDPRATLQYLPYVPAPRDLAWKELYEKYKGQIDEQFAFLAYRTAPLVSASTMDAKVITAEMANHMMVWAAIGKPNQREWVPPRGGYAKNDGLYPSGYHLFAAQPSGALQAALVATVGEVPRPPEPRGNRQAPPDDLWKGYLLPASEEDVWLAAGSVAYAQVFGSADRETALERVRTQYRGARLSPLDDAARFRLQEAKGILFLDRLRQKMGDDSFLKLMIAFYSENTGRTVTAKSFLERAKASFEAVEPGPGPAYLVSDIGRRLGSAILVYGTDREAGANRYTAEQMQADFLNQFESRVPVYKDFEVTTELLSTRDVVFVGRPEANSALAAWAAPLNLDYSGAAFRIDGTLHAAEREALLLAGSNPLNPARMVLVVAGNDALRTLKSSRVQSAFEYVIYNEGSPLRSGFLKRP